MTARERNTVNMDDAPIDKVTDKTQVQKSQNYLKVVARRSKAGFERVHLELLRRYRDSSDSGEKLAQRRSSFWRTKRIHQDKNNSRPTTLTGVGTFKSYISQSDDTDMSLDSTKCPNRINEEAEDLCSEGTDHIMGNTKGNQYEKQNEAALTVTTSTDRGLPDFIATEGTSVSEEQTVTVESDSKKEKETEQLPTVKDNTKNEIITPIYDTPRPCARNMSKSESENDCAEEDMYMKMDGNDSSDEDGGDYTNVRELLLLKKAKKESCYYVNCPKQTPIKQSSTADQVVEVYATAVMLPPDVTYATVNKPNTNKNLDNIEKAGQVENQYDYEYIDCEEFDLIANISEGKPSKECSKQNTVVPNVSKQGPNRQTKAASEPIPVESTEEHEDSYMSMSRKKSQSEFYSFSVEEVVDVLDTCAMSHVANICREEQLDGEYFRGASNKDLFEEPFNMSLFYIGKFFRVIDGWRPKHKTLKMQ